MSNSYISPPSHRPSGKNIPITSASFPATLPTAAELLLKPPTERIPLSQFCKWVSQVPEFSSVVVRQVRYMCSEKHDFILLSCQVSLSTTHSTPWLRIERQPPREEDVLDEDPVIKVDTVQLGGDLIGILLGLECDSWGYFDYPEPDGRSITTLRLGCILEMCECFIVAGNLKKYISLKNNYTWLCYLLFDCLWDCGRCYKGEWIGPPSRLPGPPISAQGIFEIKRTYLSQKHPTCCNQRRGTRPIDVNSSWDSLLEDKTRPLDLYRFLPVAPSHPLAYLPYPGSSQPSILEESRSRCITEIGPKSISWLLIESGSIPLPQFRDRVTESPEYAAGVVRQVEFLRSGSHEFILLSCQVTHSSNFNPTIWLRIERRLDITEANSIYYNKPPAPKDTVQLSYEPTELLLKQQCESRGRFDYTIVDGRSTTLQLQHILYIYGCFITAEKSGQYTVLKHTPRWLDYLLFDILRAAMINIVGRRHYWDLPTTLGLSSILGGLNLDGLNNSAQDSKLPSYDPAADKKFDSDTSPTIRVAIAGEEKKITAPTDSRFEAPSKSPAAKQGKVSAITITYEMPVSEVLEHLGHHGCVDVTTQLDASKSSEYPIVTGGFGDVYRGALQNGHAVSLKCLRMCVDSTDEGKKHLKRAAHEIYVWSTHEIYVWSKCSHRNVLDLIGVARYRDRLAMVSPWMENGNLRRFLARQLSIDRGNLCVQIADGVAYLHRENIVHGDIKADNVLMSEDNTPKLTDFGNAALKEYSLRFSTTTSGPGMSIRWTAPEVIEEITSHTTEADVYALGMTTLEIVTGSVPYNGINDTAVVRRIITKVHPPRPEQHIPSGHEHADRLWSLLIGCWAYIPQDRPTAAGTRDKMKTIRWIEMPGTTR
ncbi:Tyrosine kinase catalytic domain containing protein [Ceratobasidium theobromae]|uniref:Tyrosine kinase catalytic domain containing protein n=1 Tax=Ceratobasidium theobromae TaxID=1582974 RepID=A0A5N5QKX3_9AGAM|nr:Tyrosine kinase catalytic domain containing protein [Ceratobasidium theobromae]